MLDKPVYTGGIMLLAICGHSALALATVSTQFDPVLAEVVLGSTIEVTIIADIPEPVIAWGLDVVVSDDAVLELSEPPTIGSAWAPASTPDGDQLGGLAFPTAVSGDDVVLASLTYFAVSIGEADLMVEVTPDDPTEGFGLDPTGFAATSFVPATVIVTPEPRTLWLIVVAGTLAVCRSDPIRARRITHSLN